MRTVEFTPNHDAFLKQWESITSHQRFVVLADTNTLQHCLPLFAPLHGDHSEFEIIEVDAGEDSKSWTIAASIIERLIELQADKHTILVSLGGGMITDLGGFVASIYKRGIRSVLIPTSLLGMVDAAIGGKNGLNIDNLKNAVGTITQPDQILINPDFLATLPEEELQSGLGEMLKHAIIDSAAHWDALLQDWNSIELRPGLIQRSAQLKLSITEADPQEKGIRQQLNLGHTFGHAIESAMMSEDKPLPHGISVALGLLLETSLAVELELAKPEFAECVKEGVIKYISMPDQLPQFDQLIPYLLNDKKNAGNTVRFSLPRTFGSVACQIEASITCIQKVYNTEVQQLFSNRM